MYDITPGHPKQWFFYLLADTNFTFCCVLIITLSSASGIMNTRVQVLGGRVTWSNIVHVGLAYIDDNSMDIESRGVSPSLS